MTRFLKTADGGLVNADRVDRIERRTRPGQPIYVTRARATLSDGTFVDLDEQVDHEQALAPVVAASPGFIRLRYFAAERDCPAEVRRMPVVAWRVADDATYPVTPDDADSHGLEGVLMPDGQVVMPFQGVFENEEAWRAEMEQLAPAKLAPAKAKAEAAS